MADKQHSSQKTSPRLMNKAWLDTLKRVTVYLIVRLLTISLTIMIGVFLTVLVVNRAGVMDQSVMDKVENDLLEIKKSDYWNSLQTDEQDAMRSQMIEDAGLHLSYPLRSLRWTFNALTLEWGSVHTYRLVGSSSGSDRYNVRLIIQEKLPNTLLLICTADLLVFLVGIPLALHLSRRHGNWMDRLINTLLPISSIPSWVHGILLVILFAWTLHLLPSGRMVDNAAPPDTALGYALVVAKHMILPVTALLLNLFLQCVSTWRTFFLIYSSEDYVEYALAKGLKPRQVERRYILRPTLPYIITSFALTLIGFWQIITALEYFFVWPGIGFLYIESLKMADYLIVIGLVVVFAYLLGIIVLLLDIVYVIVDPRIRLEKKQTVEQAAIQRARTLSQAGRRQYIRQLIQDEWRRFANPLKELKRKNVKKTAVAILCLLFLCSLGFPWLAQGYIHNREQDTVYQAEMSFRQNKIFSAHAIPFNGQPVWMNLFRKEELSQTVIIDSQGGAVEKIVTQEPSYEKVVTLTFTFDYVHKNLPQDVGVIFDLQTESRYPAIISAIWTIPDGRSVELKQFSGFNQDFYRVGNYTPRAFRETHILRDSLMIVSDGYGNRDGSYDPLITLFTDPTKIELIAIPGTYTLTIKCRLQDSQDDFDARLLITGQAYGPAGSTRLHNDKLAPFFSNTIQILIISAIGMVCSFSAIIILIWGKPIPKPVKYHRHKLTTNTILTHHEQLARKRHGISRFWKKIGNFFRELVRYPSAVMGFFILIAILALSFSTPWLTKNYYDKRDKDLVWITENEFHINKIYLHALPRNGTPLWLNWLGAKNPSTILQDEFIGGVIREEAPGDGFAKLITLTYTFEYPYRNVPQDAALVFYLPSIANAPFAIVTWITPDGREIQLQGHRLDRSESLYILTDYIPLSFLRSHALYDDLEKINSYTGGQGGYSILTTLFTDPTKDDLTVIQGTYTLRVECFFFQEDAVLDNAMLVLTGQMYGPAGTDFYRNDLLEPILRGAPTVMAIGLLGSLVTTIISLIVAALSAWFGGWVDTLVQRITEAIMILPMLAIGVLLNQLFGATLWTVMIIFVLLNAFGSPVKLYRSAMLQVQEAPYIEAARAYGVNDWQIILRYMVPRVAPMLIPQIVVLIPSYIFLEALMAVFGISGFSTWGEMLYTGLKTGTFQGNYSWFLQPFVLMTLISLGFALLGSALDKIFNPRLKSG